LLAVAIPVGAQEPSHFKIGVLSTRGNDHCIEEWNPTAEYLSDHIAGSTFEIVPLTYSEINSAVEKEEIDFVLANPSFYVEIEQLFGANRIATLKHRCTGGNSHCTTYGGVVFWLKRRTDIQQLQDLKGKSFMAADEFSLGGWQIIWRELKERGFNPYKNFSRIEFSGNHEIVVLAVTEGLVDAGGIRTDILERLAGEGKVKLEDFTVLERRPGISVNLPFLCSTPEYPEWPLARLRKTSEILAEQVTIALLQMAPDSPAALAANCSGWTIPLNYQSVHDCLRYLRIGPYKNVGRITLSDIFRNYAHWVFVTVMAFAGTAMVIVIILRLNSDIAESHRRLQAEILEHRKTDEALNRAKEIAERATRAKSEFLANMSHEIRTPMNGVIAAAELAMNETLPPKAQQYMKIILSSANSLLNLLNDILDFSKIEAGKLRIESRPFMLDDVLDRVVDLFINSASAKRIELLVDIRPGTPKALLGDPLRLQQVLTNIVGNAVKFTDHGGYILIVVSATEIFSDEVALEISVTDTGIGIPPEFSETLFQPFTQADSSDTRRYEGTGLGLSICKRLVEMMRGQIRVKSEVGKGSTFTFTCRLGRQSEEPVRAFVPPEDIRHMNVLVVDDCEQSRLIVSSMLQSFGFSVMTAAGGDEALGLLRKQDAGRSPMDLVILDWLMPGIDGLETSRRIQKEFSRKIPIIMMSAFGRDIERREAEKIGIKGFLSKPLTQSTLFNGIMDALGKERYKTRQTPSRITTESSIFKRRLKGYRILVVEDNPTNQEIAVAILESAGILTKTANNGREALEMLKQHRFDAVMMDLQMPEMNGYEATKIIRSDPSSETLPVIAVTAHAMRGDEEKCMAAGMNGYVSKPVNQYELFKLLWRLLKYRQPVMEPEALETGAKAVSDAEAEPLPDETEGIRIRDALDATRLEPGVYRRILAGFLRDNTDTVSAFRKAISDGDLESVAMCAHALKGSAANIGARDLEAAAKNLESSANAKNSGSELMPLLETLDRALTTVLSSIHRLASEKFRSESVIESAGTAEPEKAIKILEELSSALDRADPREITGILDLLRDLIGRKFFDLLETTIAGYDYEEASQTVSRILEELTGKTP
jgi:signal transduction histidine kinase/CheY-like chemotaxis protein